MRGPRDSTPTPPSHVSTAFAALEPSPFMLDQSSRETCAEMLDPGIPSNETPADKRSGTSASDTTESARFASIFAPFRPLNPNPMLRLGLNKTPAEPAKPVNPSVEVWDTSLNFTLSGKTCEKNTRF